MSAAKSALVDGLGSSGGDAVTVAVRVRPFNEREKHHQAKLVVHMPNEQTTSISDANDMAPRTFTFDHCYWSHDGFVADENGYFCAREGKRYADQKKVFNDLGVEILNNAWKGYNCSLFAYGQTGSGKSYSVVGFKHNKGIVPQLCEELFRRIEQLRSVDDGIEYMVTISMMEIYCEKVRDLLAPSLLSAKGTGRGSVLKIRENPKIGFYVENLSSYVVDSRRELERKIFEGTQNRTIAATNLNETSSRAHTIVRITFVQKLIDTGSFGSGTTKTSEINLVDLAGSERQKTSSRSENERMKEGIIINKSLSTLGRVIKTLHENQQLQSQQHLTRNARPAQVPYRESVLTSLLKNALGGNSKTIMLATISPSEAAREETLATLRFAERVKSVRTRPIVNESATERMLRELREENVRLQELMKQRADALQPSATKEELQALRRQLSENQRELNSLEHSWQLRADNPKRVEHAVANSAVETGEHKVKPKKSAKSGRKAAAVTERGDEPDDEAGERDSQLSAHEFLERRRRERPHLWNLNEDPALTDVILHFIEPGENRVGSGVGDMSARIVLKGLSILPEHALLINKDNRRVTLRPLNGAEILVNGRVATGDVELQQNDRVHFGGNHLYVFTNPFRPGARTSDEISYEAAQHEIAKHSGLQGGSASDANAAPRALSDEEAALEESLVGILPDVYRANAMAKALKRDVHFEVVLLPPEMRATTSTGEASGGTEIWIKVHDNEQDASFLWDRARFASRYVGMQEVYASYADGDPDWSPPKNRDPFYEPADTPTLVGTARVFLQSLAYMVELDEQFPIVDVHGAECGQLCVSLTPSNVTGREILGEFVENPAELVNQNLAFKIKVLSALGLPRRVEESYCTYTFFDRAETSTNRAAGSNPAYAHEELFTFRPVTQELINYLTQGALTILVHGIQKCKDSTLHSTAAAQRIAAYLNGDIETPQNSPGIPPPSTGIAVSRVKADGLSAASPSPRRKFFADRTVSTLVAPIATRPPVKPVNPTQRPADALLQSPAATRKAPSPTLSNVQKSPVPQHKNPAAPKIKPKPSSKSPAPRRRKKSSGPAGSRSRSRAPKGTERKPPPAGRI